jgi:hypothetical protein
MLSFKESFNEVIEAKLKVPKGEKVVKDYGKVGKKSSATAVITQRKDGKFNLYIDGLKMDTFKKQKEAEITVTQFVKSMGLDD